MYYQVKYRGNWRFLKTVEQSEQKLRNTEIAALPLYIQADTIQDVLTKNSNLGLQFHDLVEISAVSQTINIL